MYLTLPSLARLAARGGCQAEALPGYSILPSIRASRCPEACSLTCACAGVGQVGCEIEDVKSADDIANARILIFPGGFSIRARGPTSAHGLAMSLPAFLALQSETAWSILSSRARSSAAIRAQLIQPLASSPPVLLLSSPPRPCCSATFGRCRQLRGVHGESRQAGLHGRSQIIRAKREVFLRYLPRHAGAIRPISHSFLLPPPKRDGLAETWLGSFLP